MPFNNLGTLCSIVKQKSASSSTYNSYRDSVWVARIHATYSAMFLVSNIPNNN